MSRILKSLGLSSAVMAALVCGCSCTCEGEGEGSHRHEGEGIHEHKGEHKGEHRGEHKGESKGEHGGGGEGAEESGRQYGLTDKYDDTRHGARLLLSFDAATNSFVGTVENTTKKTLERVRVEVHLSNGMELGPTKPANLTPGQKIPVKLTATSKNFKRWSAHPEVGNNEHGHSGSHENEGDGENGGGSHR